MLLGISTLFLFLCVYNLLTALALVQIGRQNLLPAYMFSVSGFAILFLSMFCSNDILFNSHDLDILFSLPVKFSEIITSKFLFLYLLNFLIGFMFMVPGGIIWLLQAMPDFMNITLYFISVFFVPLIPMCIAAGINVLIILFSSRFRNLTIISALLSFAAIGLISYACIAAIQTGQGMNSISTTLAGQITRLYPLSALFAMTGFFTAKFGICIFLILSASIYGLFVYLLSRKIHLLHTLSDTTAKYAAHKNRIKKRSPFYALYQKELRRFFSSYMSVLNTGLGVILLCTFSFFLLILPLHEIGNYLGISDPEHFLCDYAPLIVASLLTLSCSSASAISLEGKSVWILQSSPIPVQLIINSKLAVNLTLHAFGYCFAVFAFILRLHMNPIQFAGLIIIPLCYSLFTAVLGIFYNIKYPDYEWDSEMIVVKQSTSVLLSIFTIMVVVTAPLLLLWLLSCPVLPVLWGTALILISAGFVLYLQVCRSAYL